MACAFALEVCLRPVPDGKGIADDEAQGNDARGVAGVRGELLAKEKELTRRGDQLAAERRELPWVPTEKEYTFGTDQGPQTLRELFGGRSQLMVYHFLDRAAIGPSEGDPPQLLPRRHDGCPQRTWPVAARSRR